MSTRVVDIIVEIPMGSQNKYTWDQGQSRVRLDRVLHSSIHYPADYGIIPGTMAPDGEPIDALLLVTTPTFPGCLVKGKVIGCLRTHDEKSEDTKVLAVPVGDPRFAHVETLGDVSTHYLREIEYFFAAYKELEGKLVDVKGWGDAAEAAALIERYRV